MRPLHLPLSAAIRNQVGRVQRASGLYPNADDGIAPLEREQIALAVLVVDAVSRLEAATPRARAKMARASITAPRGSQRVRRARGA